MVKLKTTVITFLMVCLTAFAAQAKTMSIEVKEAQVRSAPSFFKGKLVKKLPYGYRLNVQEQKGSWYKVSEGWIHSSALTKKKVVLKAGASDVKKGATNDEIALAGKGFNEQVEEEFKSKNQNIDFTWINKMENFTVSQDQMQKFLKEGELYPEGGSQ
ncbi:MAG: SH3 domain-containing protein [Desulfobacteraceae bacterium]|nr:SH3 domain-containing protein [Desulfobacteraceae bacterium]